MHQSETRPYWVGAVERFFVLFDVSDYLYLFSLCLINKRIDSSIPARG